MESCKGLEEEEEEEEESIKCTRLLSSAMDLKYSDTVDTEEDSNSDVREKNTNDNYEDTEIQQRGRLLSTEELYYNNSRTKPNWHVDFADIHADGKLALRVGSFLLDDDRSLASFVYVPDQFDFQSAKGMNAILSALGISVPQLVFEFGENYGVVPNTSYRDTEEFWKQYPTDLKYWESWKGRDDLKQPSPTLDYVNKTVTTKRVEHVLNGISDACSHTTAVYLLSDPFRGNIFAEMACRSAIAHRVITLGIFSSDDFSVVNNNHQEERPLFQRIRRRRENYPDNEEDDHDDSQYYIKATEVISENIESPREAREANQSSIFRGNKSGTFEYEKGFVPWEERLDKRREKIHPSTFMSEMYCRVQGEVPKSAIKISCQRTELEQSFFDAFSLHNIPNGLASSCSHRLVFANKRRQKQFREHFLNLFPTGCLVVGSEGSALREIERSLQLGRPLFVLKNTGIAAEAAAELIKYGQKLKNGTLDSKERRDEYVYCHFPPSVASWNQLAISEKIWHDAYAMAKTMLSLVPHFNVAANHVFDMKETVDVNDMQDRITKVMSCAFESFPELGGTEKDRLVLERATNIMGLARTAKRRYFAQAALLQILIRVAVLAAVSLTIAQSQAQKDEQLYNILKATNIILPLVASALITLDSSFRPALKYAALLLVEKKIESEIFRYKTRTGEYRRLSSSNISQDDKGRTRALFSEKCQMFLDDCIKSDFSSGSLLSCGERWPQLRVASESQEQSMDRLPLTRQYDDQNDTQKKKKKRASSRKSSFFGARLEDESYRPSKTEESGLKKGRNNMFYSKDYDFTKWLDDKECCKRAKQVDGIFYSRNYDFKPDASFLEEEERLIKKFPENSTGQTLPWETTEVLSSQKYIEMRLDPTRKRFYQDIPILSSTHTICLILIIAFTTTATAFVAFDLEAWVPALISAAAAVEFINSFLQLDTRIPLLNGSATELTKTILWWDGLSLVESRQAMNKDALVDRCEDAIVAQYESYSGSTVRFARKNYNNRGNQDDDDDDEEKGALTSPKSGKKNS